MFGDFVKMTLDSSHWLWLETSHLVKNVTRVESSHWPLFHVSRVMLSLYIRVN